MREHGWSDGELIGLDALISIILYCDYTKLSSHFSSTFRKNGPFEPIQAIIQRNRTYYWWSKILKETIKKYGQSHQRRRGELESIIGPFYCGMSVVMNMPQFNISLLSPVSTSKHIEVALRFGGQNGMILQFNNNKGYGIETKGFDVSWISRFGGEESEMYVIPK